MIKFMEELQLLVFDDIDYFYNEATELWYHWSNNGMAFTNEEMQDWILTILKRELK